MKGLRPMKELWYPAERDVFNFIPEGDPIISL